MVNIGAGEQAVQVRFNDRAVTPMMLEKAIAALREMLEEPDALVQLTIRDGAAFETGFDFKAFAELAGIELTPDTVEQQYRCTMSKKAQTKASSPAHATQGFGVPLTAAPHHFVVVIPRGNKQPVQIVEDLGMHVHRDESELLDRVVLPRSVWIEVIR